MGVGGLGFHHARILRDMRDMQFGGFYDSRAERATAVAAELGITAHDSLDALLAGVDAVTIAVPTPAHFEVASRAIAQGKHVLIEKPITTTVAEADELLSLARANGVVVQIGHVERFNAAVRAALPHIDEPRFIQSERLAPFNPRGSDVAVVLDLMIHDIDLILCLAVGDAQSIAAVGVPVLTPTVDIANARITFASGAVANITASRISRERVRKIRIFQKTGYLSLDLAAGTGEFFRLNKSLSLESLAAAPLDFSQFVERVELTAPEGEPLKLEFESFARALTGEAPPVVTGEDGRRALEVALGIVKEIERTLPQLSGSVESGLGRSRAEQTALG
ncbi:MAG: Gfo/Idh/MocA family oxidoreductase [Gemmatimonadota bacterium]|nr:Gfo/Idh/MocA family oxidoreductase [Gemmatimonadota bacterium]